MSTIVGREDELRTIEAFLADAPTAAGALVLEGEPGIGKSTLWRRGVDLAAEGGLRVLAARPAEAERSHAHAALGDLLEEALDDVSDELPTPRLRALRVALLLEEPDPGRSSQRDVGIATRSAIELLADRGPLAIAIDDEQWLDGSSAAALRFAVRRLSAPVRLLVSRRAGSSGWVDGTLADEAVETLAVGPLSLGAIHRLVHARVGTSFPRIALRRVYETSGGNPFYAIELARALASADIGDPTQPLPVPARLEELVQARLEGFGGTMREALALAAAHPRLTPAQLDAAGYDHGALEPAVEGNVIEVADRAVRFTHPLLASVLYQSLTIGERLRAHAVLAGLVDDPVDRARHLAVSTEAPDAAVAAVVERAAASANARGAPLLAAELAEHALRLSPPEARADADRRLGEAAHAHLDAGDVERSRTLAAELLARTPRGDGRAEALVLMAAIEHEELPRAIPLLRQALREAGALPALEASIHQKLSGALRFTEGYAAAEEHARAAVVIAQGLDDDGLAGAALSALAIVRFNRGGAEALQLAEQAYDLTRACADRRARLEAEFALAHVLVWSRDNDRARAVLAQMQREWVDRAEYTTAMVAWYRSLVELHSGRVQLAAELAEHAREVSVQYARDEAESPQNLFVLALVAAHEGALDRARGLAEQSLRLTETSGALLAGPSAVLGLVDLWGGDVPAAVVRFAGADRTAARADQAEPATRWWCGEHVEALLVLDRVDDGVTLLADWEDGARRVGRAWVLAHAARCRGLVAAARGDVGGAEEQLDAAATRHDALGDPFAKARALLALGAVRRRARQKRPAREAIEAAAATFDEIGASGWAERARGELGRIGGRTRSDDLTPAERRVAELVAEGRTNREVAATLFLAERTVETHLSHVYAKLGVRSRTELARRL
jgi:DNA-binding CsgD family transcriptional regulator